MGLAELGRAIGYHVEEEYPVKQACHGTPPAVDVAWFTEKEQDFPIFIFEVESRASNAMAYNPLKVFSQETRRFEKPLFFFQVVNASTEKSSRIGDLEKQYGTYNYRIYVIGNNNANELIQDILKQHRRIKKDIDYIELYNVLSEKWAGNVDVYQALRNAFDAGLSRELRLPAYVQLAISDENIFHELRRAIQTEAQEKWPSVGALPSYLGKSWGVMILCSLMIRWSENDSDAKHWNEELLRWQESTTHMPMITASFGLSQDYDEFLIGEAAPLIVLCCVLVGDKGTFKNIFCDVLVDILAQLKGSWYVLYTACWLANISARFGMEKHFRIAMESINEFGGVAQSALYCPPSAISTEITEDEAFPVKSRSLCPNVSAFQARAQHTICSKNPESIAFNALNDDTYQYKWANDLVGALWNFPERG